MARVRPTPLIALHLRRVGTIALVVGLLAVTALFVAVMLVGHDGGGTYGEIFQAHSLSRRQLGPVLLLAGLGLVAISALVTWLVVVYSSFRVAGPLHHFATSLEQEMILGPMPVERIRQEDLLQEEYWQFAVGAERLQAHYDAMSELVDLARVQLELAEPNMGDGLTKTLLRLKELERLVHL
ncbi:MAG: hypothetical protein HQL57_03835 [Magnetococcales bacterium]|nr:hypothetical protein [Magnetococcales bacterium]